MQSQQDESKSYDPKNYTDLHNGCMLYVASKHSGQVDDTTTSLEDNNRKALIVDIAANEELLEEEEKTDHTLDTPTCVNEIESCDEFDGVLGGELGVVVSLYLDPLKFKAKSSRLCDECLKKTYVSRLSEHNKSEQKSRSFIGRTAHLFGKKKALKELRKDAIHEWPDAKAEAKQKLKEKLISKKLQKELIKSTDILQQYYHLKANITPNLNDEDQAKIDKAFTCYNEELINDGIDGVDGEDGECARNKVDPKLAHMRLAKSFGGYLDQDYEFSYLGLSQGNYKKAFKELHDRTNETNKDFGAKCVMTRDKYVKAQSSRLSTKGYDRLTSELLKLGLFTSHSTLMDELGADKKGAPINHISRSITNNIFRDNELRRIMTSSHGETLSLKNYSYLEPLFKNGILPVESSNFKEQKALIRATIFDVLNKKVTLDPNYYIMMYDKSKFTKQLRTTKRLQKRTLT